jgi:DNA replication protein DnaC
MTLTLPLQQTEVQAYEALTCKHFDYKSTIEAINKLLTYNDRKPKGLLVTGVAGVGKTFIAEQTERALSASDTKELSTIPVIYIDASLMYCLKCSTNSAILNPIQAQSAIKMHGLADISNPLK